MAGLIQPQSARLRLRQWRLEDRDAFAALNADPRVMEFFCQPLDRAASDEFAQRASDKLAERGWGLWAVEVIGAAPFIGFVGLSIPEYDTPASPCVEIGWRLAHKHWGEGYATEAAMAALRVGFEQLLLEEIVSFTAVGNRRSRAVMERIGMRDCGERFEHPRVPEGHPLRPHVLYRLSREQWGAAKETLLKPSRSP